jgi:hypothetical protein
MSRATIVRLLAPGLAILALAACSAGSMGGAGGDAVGPSGTTGQNQTSLATQQSCRQQVNETIDKQNRPAIYAANSSLNSPFSANFEPNVASRGLSGQFAYEQALSDCERGAATGPDVPSAAPDTAAKGR